MTRMTARSSRDQILKIPATRHEKAAVAVEARREGISQAEWMRGRLFGTLSAISPVIGLLTEEDEHPRTIVLLALIAGRLEELRNVAGAVHLDAKKLDELLALRGAIVQALNELFRPRPDAPNPGPSTP